MARKKEFPVEETLEKAMKVFWDHGYERTSIQDLVDAMGINRFSIYDTYGQKDALFYSCLKRYNELHIQGTRKALTESPEGIESIRTVLKDFTGFIKGQTPNGCLMINTVIENDAINDRIKKLCKKYLKDLEKSYAAALTRAVALGEIPPDTDINRKARYLVGCAQGLGVIIKVMSKEDLFNYIDTVMEALAV